MVLFGKFEDSIIHNDQEKDILNSSDTCHASFRNIRIKKRHLPRKFVRSDMPDEIFPIGTRLIYMERSGFHHIQCRSIVSLVKKHLSATKESLLTIECKCIPFLTAEGIKELYRVEDGHNPKGLVIENFSYHTKKMRECKTISKARTPVHISWWSNDATFPTRQMKTHRRISSSCLPSPEPLRLSPYPLRACSPH